jgi:ParB-like chromosome segregation protein Spo0J
VKEYLNDHRIGVRNGSSYPKTPRNRRLASPEEVIERALELLSQQDWLAENRHQIAVEIQEGWDEAQSSTLIQAEEARANLQTRKRDWSKQ